MTNYAKVKKYKTKRWLVGLWVSLFRSLSKKVRFMSVHLMIARSPIGFPVTFPRLHDCCELRKRLFPIKDTISCET
jgi:hypothetical protein